MDRREMRELIISRFNIQNEVVSLINDMNWEITFGPPILSNKSVLKRENLELVWNAVQEIPNRWDDLEIELDDEHIEFKESIHNLILGEELYNRCRENQKV